MFGNLYKLFFGGFFFMGEGFGEVNCKKKYGCVFLICINFYFIIKLYVFIK